MAKGELGRRLTVVDGERVEVETFPVPEPGPGQVLVRVSRTQVSAGSEKGRFLGTSPDDPEHPEGYNPNQPGYTAVGRVEAVGEGVDEFGPGDRVFVTGRHSSHHLIDLLVDRGGTEGPIQRIEFDITDEQACFSRLGDVALHSIRRAQLQPDESVAIFGQGVVGQLIAAVCRVAGANPIIGLDLDETRLALSKKSGATHTIDVSKHDPAEAISQITGGRVQCVFHANREAQVLEDCIRVAGYGGKIVLVGSTPGTAKIRLREILVRELEIRGSHWNTGTVHPYWPWTMQRDRHAVMRMIASGDLKVDHLISHVARPEDADELYGKIVAGPKGWMGILFNWEDDG